MVIIGIFVLVNLCACAPVETCVRVGEMNFPPERIGLAVEQQIAAMYEPGMDEIYTRQGISTIRRVSGAFDHVNEDVPYGAVNIGTQFRVGGSEAPDYARINAMMPESVFAYTTTFKVPENWSGLQTLRQEITGVYASMNAAALFGFTDEQNARMSTASLLYGILKTGP